MNDYLRWKPLLGDRWQDQWQSTQDRRALLSEFFRYHIDAGLIGPETVAHVSNVERLDNQGFGINLTVNPGRKDRGVSAERHPSPAHIIPFKGGIPCFCCPDVLAYQWPLERGVWVDWDRPMVILPNIFPLFPNHFTVVSSDHRPQTIDIPAVHAITPLLPSAWVVQNDGDAGATNPWHFHLQVFYDDGLPLSTFAIQRALAPHIGVLDHPALILKITDPGVATRCAARYLSLGDTRRLNVLARGDVTYLVLRDTRFRTDLYVTGQPGFPEPAGLLAVPTEQAAEVWRSTPGRYHQLMTDIAPSDDQTQDFLAGMRIV